MSKLPDILPCPFCGGSASVEEHPGSTTDYKNVAFSVGCDSPDEAECMYPSFQIFSLRSDAIKAWNHRAQWQKQRDALKLLKETIDIAACESIPESEWVEQIITLAQSLRETLSASPTSPAPAEESLLGNKNHRIAHLTLENEGLRQALKPFSIIGLVRDADPDGLDMIDAPDLSISPTMVRAAREALRRFYVGEAPPSTLAAKLTTRASSHIVKPLDSAGYRDTEASSCMIFDAGDTRMLLAFFAASPASPSEWLDIASAPKEGEEFILLYCAEDDSQWWAKWQHHRWQGIDQFGLTREGASFGNPDVVTRWFVTHWRPRPASPPVQQTAE